MVKRPQRLVSILVPLLLGVMTLSLAACGGEPAAASPEAATTPEAAAPDVVRATGVAAPPREALLSFTTGGQLIDLAVEVGQRVQTGQVIARLDPAVLDAEVGKAEAALALAEAELAQALAGTPEGQIDEAQDNLAAASAAAALAAAQREALESMPLEAQIIEAQIAVKQAEINLMRERTEYDWVMGVEGRPGDYTELERQILPYQKEDAARELEQARMEYTAAAERLNTLMSGANPDQLRAANAQIAAASADYQAQAAVVAQLEAGPREQLLAALEARVRLAEASLEQARLARQQAEMTAPFDGTISAIYLREAQYTNPGQPVVLMADLTTLQVKTTDLSELDVARIAVGDRADIRFDALPGMVIEGTVTQIAPGADIGTGSTFTVTLALSEIPDRLRWGMTALIEITPSRR